MESLKFELNYLLLPVVCVAQVCYSEIGTP